MLTETVALGRRLERLRIRVYVGFSWCLKQGVAGKRRDHFFTEKNGNGEISVMKTLPGLEIATAS